MRRMQPPVIKLLILKNSPDTYLIGKLSEMDEEPSLLLEDSYRVVEEGLLSVSSPH